MNCWSTRISERRTLAAEDMPGARDESDTVSETSLTPAVPSGQVGEAIRGRFPVFRDKVYVNSCSQGALSDAVRAAYEEYLDGWDENGAEWEHWVERSEAARAAFAGLLGAAPDDVAIQTSVSAAVSGLVSALQFRGERNRIVISANEFPTIGQIAHAQELRGAEVVQVEPDPEAYAAAIDERTALVCSTFVSYRTGAVHDVEAIYGLAREHGALMLVDGYQGIGALPLEAAKAGDVVVGGTVKYLLASAGLAFMALRPGLVEELVPVQTGWFADENVFDMQIERYRPHRSARRFDAGTPPVPNIYAGVAGVGLILEVGVPAIQEHVRGLVARLMAGLEELGAKVATPPLGPLVCVRSTDAPAFVAALAEDDDRRVRARLQPSHLAPPLQHRGRRRRRSRRACAQPPPDPLAFPASEKGGPCLESSLAISDDLPRSPRSACSGEPSSSRSASACCTSRSRSSGSWEPPRSGSEDARRSRGCAAERAGPVLRLPDAAGPRGRRRSAQLAQRRLESPGSTGKGCATALVDAPSRPRAPDDGLRRSQRSGPPQAPSASSPPGVQR